MTSTLTITKAFKDKVDFIGSHLKFLLSLLQERFLLLELSLLLGNEKDGVKGIT